MFVGQKVPWSTDSTVIRMPIPSKFIEDGTESGWTEITQIFENFIRHASRTLVFLKSVSEVIRTLLFFCMTSGYLLYMI